MEGVGSPPSADERAGGSFAADLARSVMTVLRNGLIDSLRPHITPDGVVSRRLLHQVDLLRNLRWYQAGLNQMTILARAERATVAIVCLDMLPDHFSTNASLPEHVILHHWLAYDQLSSALGVKGSNEMLAEFVNLFVADCLVFTFRAYEGGLDEIEASLVKWAMYQFQRYSKLKEGEITPVGYEVVTRWADLLHCLTPWASEHILTSVEAKLNSTMIVDRTSLVALPILIKGLSKIRLEPLTEELFDSLERLATKLFTFAAFTFSISTSMPALTTAWTELLSNYLIQRHVTHLVTSVVPTQHGDIAIQLTPNSPLSASRVALFDALLANFKSHKRLQSLRGEFRDYHPAFNPRKPIASIASSTFQRQLIMLGANSGAPSLRASPFPKEVDLRHSTISSHDSSPMLICGSPIGFGDYSFDPMGISPNWHAALSMNADLSIADVLSTLWKKPSHMCPVLVTTIFHAPRTLEQLSFSDKYTPKSTLVTLNAIYYIVSNYLEPMRMRMNASPSSFDIQKGLMELLLKLDSVIYEFYKTSSSRRSSSSSISLLASTTSPRSLAAPSTVTTTTTTTSSSTNGRSALFEPKSPTAKRPRSVALTLDSTTLAAAREEASSPLMSPERSPDATYFSLRDESSYNPEAAIRDLDLDTKDSSGRKVPKLRAVLGMVRLMIKILHYCSFSCFISPYKCWTIPATRGDFHRMLLAASRRDHQTRILCLSSIFEAIKDPHTYEMIETVSKNQTPRSPTGLAPATDFASTSTATASGASSSSSNALGGASMANTGPGSAFSTSFGPTATTNSSANSCGFLFHWFRDITVCSKDMSVDVSMLGKMELVGLLCLASHSADSRAIGLDLLHHMRLAETDKVTLNSTIEAKTVPLLKLALQRISRQDPQMHLELRDLSSSDLWERTKLDFTLWRYFLAELCRSYSAEDNVLNSATTTGSGNFDALAHVMTLFEFAKEQSPLISSYLLLLFSLPNDMQIDFAGRVLASAHFQAALNSPLAPSAIFAVQSSSFASLPLVVEHSSTIASTVPANPFHTIASISMIAELLLCHIGQFGSFSKPQRDDKVNPKQRAYKKHQHLLDQICAILNQGIHSLGAEGALSSISLTLRTYCFDQIVLLIAALALVHARTFSIHAADTEELVSDVLGAKLVWVSRADKLAICHFLQVELFNHNVSCHAILHSSAENRRGSLPGSSSGIHSTAEVSKDSKDSQRAPSLSLATPTKQHAKSGSSTGLLGHDRTKSGGSSLSIATASLTSSTPTPSKSKNNKSFKFPYLANPLTQACLDIMANPLPIGLELLSSHTLIAWECLAQIGILNELDLPIFGYTAFGLAKSASTQDRPSTPDPAGSANKHDVGDLMSRQFTPRGTHVKPTLYELPLAPTTTAMTRVLELDSSRYSILKWVLHYQRRDFKTSYDLVINQMLHSPTYKRNFVIALASQFVTLPEEAGRRLATQPSPRVHAPIYPDTMLTNHSLMSGCTETPEARKTPTHHLANLPRFKGRVLSLPLHQQLLFPCLLLADSDRGVRRLARDMLRLIITEQEKPLPSSLTSEGGLNASIGDIEGVALATVGQIAEMFAEEAPTMVTQFLEKIHVASPLEQVWLANLTISFGVHVAPLTDRILDALYVATQSIDSRLDVHVGRIWGSLVHTVRPTWKEDLKIVIQFLLLASSTRATISKILLSIYEVSDNHAIRILSILLGLMESKSMKVTGASKTPSRSHSSTTGNSAPAPAPSSTGTHQIHSEESTDLSAIASLDSQQAVEALIAIIDSSPERLSQVAPRLVFYCFLNYRDPIFTSLLASILERSSISLDIPIPIRLDMCHTAALMRGNGLAHIATTTNATSAYGARMAAEQRRRAALLSDAPSELVSLETNYDDPSDWDLTTYMNRIIAWMTMVDTRFPARFFRVTCEYSSKCTNKDMVHNQSNLSTAFTIYTCLVDNIQWTTKADDIREQTTPLIILLTDLVTVIELEHSGEILTHRSAFSHQQQPYYHLQRNDSSGDSTQSMAVLHYRYQESQQLAQTLASISRVLVASHPHSFWALVAMLYSTDQNIFSQGTRALLQVKLHQTVLIETPAFDKVVDKFWLGKIPFLSVVDVLLGSLNRESSQHEEPNVLALALTLAKTDLRLVSGTESRLLPLFVAFFTWYYNRLGTQDSTSNVTRGVCHHFVSLLLHMQQKAGSQGKQRRAGGKGALPATTLLADLLNAFEKYLSKPLPTYLSVMVESLCALYLPKDAEMLVDAMCAKMRGRPKEASGVLVLAKTFLETSSSREAASKFPKLIALAFELSLDVKYNISYELQQLVEVSPLVVSQPFYAAPASSSSRGGGGGVDKSHGNVGTSAGSAPSSARDISSPKKSRRSSKKSSKQVESAMATSGTSGNGTSGVIGLANGTGTGVEASGHQSSGGAPISSPRLHHQRDASSSYVPALDAPPQLCLASQLLELVIDAMEGEAVGLRQPSRAPSISPAATPHADVSRTSSTTAGSSTTHPPPAGSSNDSELDASGTTTTDDALTASISASAAAAISSSTPAAVASTSLVAAIAALAPSPPITPPPTAPKEYPDDDAATELEVQTLLAKRRKKKLIQQNVLHAKPLLDSMRGGVGDDSSNWKMMSMEDDDDEEGMTTPDGLESDETHSSATVAAAHTATGSSASGATAATEHHALPHFASSYRPRADSTGGEESPRGGWESPRAPISPGNPGMAPPSLLSLLPLSPSLPRPIQPNVYHLVEADDEMHPKLVEESILRMINDHVQLKLRKPSLRNVQLSLLHDHFPFICSLLGSLSSCLEFLLHRADLTVEAQNAIMKSSSTGIIAIASLKSPSIYLLFVPPTSRSKSADDRFKRQCYKMLKELTKTHFVFFKENEVRELSRLLNPSDMSSDDGKEDSALKANEGTAIQVSISNNVPGGRELFRRASTTNVEVLSNPPHTLVGSKTSITPLNIPASTSSLSSTGAIGRIKRPAPHITQAYHAALPIRSNLASPILASGVSNLLLVPEKVQQNTKLDMSKILFSPEAFEKRTTSSRKLSSKSLQASRDSSLNYFVSSWIRQGGRVKFFPDFVSDRVQMIDFFRRYSPDVNAAMAKLETKAAEDSLSLDSNPERFISRLIDYHMKRVVPIEYRLVNQFSAPGASDAVDEELEIQIKHFEVELDACCPASLLVETRRCYYEALWIINKKEKKNMAKGMARMAMQEKTQFIEKVMQSPKFYKRCISRISDHAPMILFVTENMGNVHLPLVTPEIQTHIANQFLAIAKNAETIFCTQHREQYVSWMKMYLENELSAQLFDMLVPVYNDLIGSNFPKTSDSSQSLLASPSSDSSARQHASPTDNTSEYRHSSHHPNTYNTPPPLVLTIYKFEPIEENRSTRRSGGKRASANASKSPGNSPSPKQQRRRTAEDKKLKNSRAGQAFFAGTNSYELTFVEEKIDGSPRLLYSSYYISVKESESAKLIEARSKPLWIFTQNEQLLQVLTVKDGSVFSFIYNIPTDETVIYVSYAKDLKSTSLRKTEASRFAGRPTSMVLSPKQKLIAIAMERNVKIMNVNWEGSVWSQLFDFPQENPIVDVHFAGSSRLVVFTTNGTETFMRVYFLELISAFIDNGGVSHSEGPLVSIPSAPGRLLTPNGQFLILLDDMLCASVYDLDMHLKLPKFTKPIAGQVLTSPIPPAAPTALNSASTSFGTSTPVITITSPSPQPQTLTDAKKPSFVTPDPSSSSTPSVDGGVTGLADGSCSTVEKVSLGLPVASLMIAPKFHRFVLPSKINMLTINNHLYLVGLTDDGLECLALEDLQGMNTTARSVSMAPNLISTLESSSSEVPNDSPQTMRLTTLASSRKSPSPGPASQQSSSKPSNVSARLTTLCAPVLHLFSDRRQVVTESPLMTPKLGDSQSSEMSVNGTHEESEPGDNEETPNTATTVSSPVTVHFVVAGLDTKTMSTLSCRQMFKLIVANSTSDVPHSEPTYTLSDLPTNITVLVSSQSALEALKAPLVLPWTTKSAKQPESLQSWFTTLISLLPLRIARVVNDKLVVDQASKQASAPLTLGTPRNQTSSQFISGYTAVLGAYHALLNDWSGPIKVISSIGTPTRHHLATKAFKIPPTVIPPEDLQPGVYISSSVVSNTTLNSAPCLYLHFDIVPPIDPAEHYSRLQLILFACAVSTSLLWHSSHDETDTFTLLFKLLDEAAEHVSRLSLTAVDDPQFDPSVTHFAGKLFVFMSNVVASAQASSAAKLFKETYKESRKTKKNFTSRLFGNNLPSLFLFPDVNALTYANSSENLKQATEGLAVKSEMGEKFASHICFVLTRVAEFGQAQATQQLQTSTAHHLNTRSQLDSMVSSSEQQSHLFQTMPIMTSEEMMHHAHLHGHHHNGHNHFSEQVHSSSSSKPAKSPQKPRRDKSAPASPRAELSPRKHVQPPLRSATTTRKLALNGGGTAISRADPSLALPLHQQHRAQAAPGNSTLEATAASSSALASPNTTPSSPRSRTSSSNAAVSLASPRSLKESSAGIPPSPVSSPRRLSPASSSVVPPQEPLEPTNGGSKSSDELPLASPLEILRANLENAVRFGCEVSGAPLTITTPSTLRIISDPIVEIGQKKFHDSGMDFFAPETATIVTNALVAAQVPSIELHAELAGLLEYLLTRRLSRVGTWIEEYLGVMEQQETPVDEAKTQEIREQFQALRKELQSMWTLCEQTCNHCGLTCSLPCGFHESMADLGLVLIDSEEPIGESSEDSAVRRMGMTYRHDCATDHKCGEECDKCQKPCMEPWGHPPEKPKNILVSKSALALAAATASSSSSATTSAIPVVKHNCKESHPCGAPCHLAPFKLRGCGVACTLPEGHATLGHAPSSHNCLKEHMCNQYCAFCDQYCQFKFTEKHKSHTCGQTVCGHSCEIHRHCSRPCVLGHNHTELHYCGVKEK